MVTNQKSSEGKPGQRTGHQGNSAVGGTMSGQQSGQNHTNRSDSNR